ncbi:MAG: iron-sulfur cluster assembly accessory protein [Limisphaerales bacterium]
MPGWPRAARRRSGWASPWKRRRHWRPGSEAGDLLNQALDNYTDVLYNNNLRGDEQPDSFWRKKAGLQAAPLVGILNNADAERKFYVSLKKLLPQLADSIDRKIAALRRAKKMIRDLTRVPGAPSFETMTESMTTSETIGSRHAPPRNASPCSRCRKMPVNISGSMWSRAAVRGMQYGMVFDEKRDGDLASEQHGVEILVDPISAQYLRGTVVDFSDELSGGGFKILNPNAKESCGCGKSFAT